MEITEIESSSDGISHLKPSPVYNEYKNFKCF